MGFPQLSLCLSHSHILSQAAQLEYKQAHVGISSYNEGSHDLSAHCLCWPLINLQPCKASRSIVFHSLAPIGSSFQIPRGRPPKAHHNVRFIPNDPRCSLEDPPASVIRLPVSMRQQDRAGGNLPPGQSVNSPSHSPTYTLDGLDIWRQPP